MGGSQVIRKNLKQKATYLQEAKPSGGFRKAFCGKTVRERVVGITHESYLGNRYENPLFDSGVHLCDSGGADLCLPLCQRSSGNAGDRRVGFFERSAVAAGQ